MDGIETDFSTNPRGSVWHRWEPHIHVPGTILNNQYSGPAGGWDDFVNRINLATPTIKALGITDYYSLESYKKLSELNNAGRLTSTALIFPNVELRFDIGTSTNSAINGHLLVSPEDPGHVQMIERFLNKLSFTAHGQRFNCYRDDLIRLGRSHTGDASLAESPALRAGTSQFKVNFEQLLDQLQNDKWARNNILLAIATNTGDGTSGLSNDSSFASIRKNMERNSQIMFASSESQRLFWLGKGVATKESLILNYNGCKPCIHGSDAHQNEHVGKPTGNRYTWIKGDVTFESLRQICIEPEDRVFVGESFPGSNVASQTIEQILVTNVEWMRPSTLQINSGLVAIIGARGSGKTALADLIAAGGYASIGQFDEKSSFISRAKRYLNTVNVELRWEAGTTTSTDVDVINYDIFEDPRVQYLSQKFVDQLCSAEDGVTENLLREVERVIFNSHSPNDRLGMTDFNDLLAFRASNARNCRMDGERLLQDLSILLTVERNKKNSIDGLSKRIEEKNKLIQTDLVSRQNLVGTGQPERVKALEQVSTALEHVSKKLDSANRRNQALLNLRSSVASARSTSFPNYLSKLKQNHSDASLTPDLWEAFQVDFIGEVDVVLGSEIEFSSKVIQDLLGATPLDNNIKATSPQFVGDYTGLSELSFNVLKNEAKRLEMLIGVDTTNEKQYSRLSAKISKEEGELEKLQRELINAQGASERIQQLLVQKKEAYKNVFTAILEEEAELIKLYNPLMQNLSSNLEILKKLSFNVKRNADTLSWAEKGEELLDLRKQGDFRGKGSLLAAVNSELKDIWETGTSDEIATAINNFRNNYERTILAHAPIERSDQAAFNQWATKIGDWLYNTEHISVRYGIQYDGVDIRQLSPGTRGIVLLLLYLAVDKEDDRPLIIDQPEENLDPKSIFVELVPLFISAKKRRQVIIVTHNANLVVNSDADQVIIAKGGEHRPGTLPIITYTSGGLENSSIRKDVCEILEGGAEAFKERAKRLRVLLDN